MIQDSDVDFSQLIITELAQYIQYFGHSRDISELNKVYLEEIIGFNEAGVPVSWKKNRRFNSLSSLEYGKGYLIKSNQVDYELFSEDEMIPNKMTLEGEKTYIVRYLGSTDYLLNKSEFANYIEEVNYLENGNFYSWNRFQQNGVSLLKRGKTYQIKTSSFDGSFDLWNNTNPPPYLGASITIDLPETIEKISGSVVLSVVTLGLSNPTYIWQKKESGGVYLALSNSLKYSGATTNQITINNISYEDHNDKYRCIISDNNNTLFSKETTLLTSNFLIALQPNSTTLQDSGLINEFLNTSNHLKVVVTGGSGTYTYQWQYSGIDAQGNTTWTNMPIDLVSGDSYTSSSINRITTLRPGGNSPVYGSISGQERYGQKTFRCRVSDGQSVLYSNSATINSIPFSANITTQPQSVQISNNIIIYVEYDSPVPVVWKYIDTDNIESYVSSTEANTQYSTINISGVIRYRNTLTITNLDHSKVGRKYYALVGSVDGGIKTSNPSILLGNPPIIVSQPSSSIVDYYGNILLSINWINTSTSATANWQYSSSLDLPNWTNVPTPPLPGTGTISSNSQSSILSLSGITESNSGFYRVVLTYSSGSVISSVAKISVLDPSIIISGPSDITVNAGTTAIFSPTYTSSNNQRLTYQWYVKFVGDTVWNSAGQAAGSSTNFSVGTTDTSKSGRKYKVIAKLGSLEITSREATLTVLSNATVTPTPTKTPTPTPIPSVSRCSLSVPLYASIFTDASAPAVANSTGILELKNYCSNPQFLSLMSNQKGLNERLFCINRRLGKMYVYYDNGSSMGRGIDVIDTQSGVVRGSVLESLGGAKLGRNSLIYAMDVDTDRNKLYLANYPFGQLYIVDCLTDTLIKSIDSKSGGMIVGLKHIVVNRRSGKTYIASSSQVCVIDNTTDSVLKKITVPGNQNYQYGPICDICVDTKRNIIYLCLNGPRKNNMETNKEIIAINGNTDEFMGSFYSFNSVGERYSGHEPIRMVVNPVTNKMYVRTFELSWNTLNGQPVSSSNPALISDGRKVYYGRSSITVLTQNQSGATGTFNKIIPINGLIKLNNNQNIPHPAYNTLSPVRSFANNSSLSAASKALEIDINSNTIYAGLYNPSFVPSSSSVAAGQLGAYVVGINGNGDYPDSIVDGVARGYPLCSGSCSPEKFILEMHNVQPAYVPINTSTPTPTPAATNTTPIPTPTPTPTPTAAPVTNLPGITKLVVENTDNFIFKINRSDILNQLGPLASINHYAVLLVDYGSHQELISLGDSSGLEVVGGGDLTHPIMSGKIPTLRYFPRGVFDEYQINLKGLQKNCTVSLMAFSDPFTNIVQPNSNKFNACIYGKFLKTSVTGRSIGSAWTTTTYAETPIFGNLPEPRSTDAIIRYPIEKIVSRESITGSVSSTEFATVISILPFDSRELHKIILKIESTESRKFFGQAKGIGGWQQPQSWYFFGCYGEGGVIPNGVTLAAPRFIPYSTLLYSVDEGENWEALNLPYPLQCLGLVWWQQKFWLFHIHPNGYLTAISSDEGRTWVQSDWNFGNAKYSSTTANNDIPYGRTLRGGNPIGKPGDVNQGAIKGYGGMTISVIGGVLYVAAISEINGQSEYLIFRIYKDLVQNSILQKVTICSSFISVVSKIGSNLLLSGNMISYDNGFNWTAASEGEGFVKDGGTLNSYGINNAGNHFIVNVPKGGQSRVLNGIWQSVDIRIDPEVFSSSIGPKIGSYCYGITWDDSKGKYCIIRVDPATSLFESLVELKNYAGGRAVPYFGKDTILNSSNWQEGTKWNFSNSKSFNASNIQMGYYRYGSNETLPASFINGTNSPPGMGEVIFTKNKVIVLYRYDKSCWSTTEGFNSGCVSLKYDRFNSGVPRPWQPR